LEIIQKQIFGENEKRKSFVHNAQADITPKNIGKSMKFNATISPNQSQNWRPFHQQLLPLLPSLNFTPMSPEVPI
jgi:hypothetical protein